jgi:hypothetical protein
MTQSKIPDPLERRHLIEKDLPAEQSLAIAEAYLADERRTEAVVFLGKAGAEQQLQELAEVAVEAGDVFLLTEVSRARGREPEPATWERLEASARRVGKDQFAEAAHRRAARSDD